MSYEKATDFAGRMGERYKETLDRHLEQTSELIDKAQAELGGLTDGQRTDLITDNFSFDLQYIRTVLVPKLRRIV